MSNLMKKKQEKVDWKLEYLEEASKRRLEVLFAPFRLAMRER